MVNEGRDASGSTGSQDGKPKPPKPTWGSRLKPLLFVLAGFGCWFVFFTLARVLLECAPFGPCSVSDLPPPEPLEWPDTIVLLTTMLFAIWAAKRLVFAGEE